MVDRKKQIEKLFAAVSSRDEAVIRELFAEDAVLIEGAPRLKDPKAKVKFEGIEDILGFFLSETKSDDHFRIEPAHHIQEGNWIATEWTVTREIESVPDVRHGVDLYQFEGDKIVYGKVFVDLASLPPFRDAPQEGPQVDTGI